MKYNLLQQSEQSNCIYSMARENRHSDKEIKDWVCAHIHQLLQERESAERNELKAEIKIMDEHGISHNYTVFLELSELNGKAEWIVRNIVRPEQLR